MKAHSLAIRTVLGAAAISSVSATQSFANMPSEKSLPVSAVGALLDAIPNAAEQLRQDDARRSSTEKEARPTIYFAVSSTIGPSKDTKIKRQNLDSQSLDSTAKRNVPEKRNTIPPGPPVKPPVKPPVSASPNKN